MKIVFSFFFTLFLLPVSAQEKISDYLVAKGSKGKNTWAIIIANEDYQSYFEGYTENEELTIYQAERFRQMLIKQAGVPAENIILYTDAVNTNIKLAIAKLQKTLTPDSKIIFYFRGKTFQNKLNSEVFMVPIDSDGKEKFYMFGLEDLSKRLSNLNVATVDIFVDALPDKTSGTLCILDNGFVKLSDAPSKYLNLFIYKVKEPVTKTEPAQPYAKTEIKKPEIKITTPGIDEFRTNESTVLIKGNIESDCPVLVVAVNGEEASLGEKGTFAAQVALTDGENNISLEAKNCTGWGSKNITITKLALPADSMKDLHKIDSVQVADTSALKPAGKNYALLIGVSKYKNAIMPDLFYPIKDAERLKVILTTHYTFYPQNVICLVSPEKSKIISILDSLSKVLKADDSFLMFYAGHGSWDEKSRMGYWLPSDAAPRVFDNWIMNSIITGYVSLIRSKHTLIIADACFGGSIFRTRAFIPAEEKSITELYMKSSRKAMTSGDLTEVPDESIFLKYFLQKLEENNEKYVSSEKLFFEVKPKVADMINLIPQFGIIKNAGDEGGDFIFFKK